MVKIKYYYGINGVMWPPIAAIEEAMTLLDDIGMNEGVIRPRCGSGRYTIPPLYGWELAIPGIDSKHSIYRWSHDDRRWVFHAPA